MSDAGGIKATYQNVLVSAITGKRPTECYIVHDATALDNMLTKFVDAEKAISILRHLGYGDFGMSLVEVANLVPKRAA